MNYSLEPSLRKWPPSNGALVEHIKQAAYIAGHLWGTAHLPRPDLPSLVEWGFNFTANGTCVPVWTKDVSSDIYKKIGHSYGCRGKNPCVKSNCGCSTTRCLPILCKCKGKCIKDAPEQFESDENDSDDSDD